MSLIKVFQISFQDLNETICQTDISGLDVIASGPVPPNPTSLLQNDNFRHLMEVARSRYDYVIIDTPPIGLVIDAVIIAHQADASLLVTAAGKIKRRFVAKAVEQLDHMVLMAHMVSTGKNQTKKKVIQEHIVVEKDSINGDDAAPYTLTDKKGV